MTLLRFDTSTCNRRANSDNPILATLTLANSSNSNSGFPHESEREFKAIIAELMFRVFAVRDLYLSFRELSSDYSEKRQYAMPLVVCPICRSQ
jgi:hypothetical protein